MSVALRNRDDQPQICQHQLLLRALVSTLDPFRQSDLLGRAQQRHLADLSQKEVE